MNISEIVHQCCDNYFNLESPEVENPVSKVILSIVKALSMATLVIPLAVYLTDRIALANQPIGTSTEKMDAATTSVFRAKPISKAELANRAETKVQYDKKSRTSEPVIVIKYVEKENGKKRAIEEYDARANADKKGGGSWNPLAAREPTWNPFKGLVEHPALIFFQKYDTKNLMAYLQVAFEKEPEELLGWIKLNPNFFLYNSIYPLPFELHVRQSFNDAQKEILLSMPITELKMLGECNFNLESSNIHSTLGEMKHLEKIDARAARHVLELLPIDSQIKLNYSFFSGLKIDDLSIYASVFDLENLTGLSDNITKLTIRTEKDDPRFNEVNDKIKQNLQNLPNLEEITLILVPTAQSGFIRNIPDKCKVLKIETSPYGKISVDALIERFQNSPLDALYLRNYNDKRYHYSAEDIEKLKQAKIAQMIVVQEY